MANKLFTTRGSEAILTELFHWTKIEYAALARIAIALSIKQTASRVNIEKDETGKEFNRYSLAGSYDIFLKSILSLVHGRQLTDEEYFSTYMKSHLDDGCTILNRLWKESEASVDQFLAKISAAAPSIPTEIYHGRVPRFEITVGHDQLTNEPVVLRLNDTRKHANPHLSIMGKPGTGKTQSLLKILADIRTYSNFETNFIFLDYKGDVASNQTFVEATQSQVFSLPRDVLPINPFVLPNYDPKQVKFSAEEKAESFASFDHGLGPLQKGKFSRAIEQAYEARRQAGVEPYPDFRDINQQVRLQYEEGDEDKLTEILRRLTDFGLFWDHQSSQELYDTLHDKTFIVDLSKLPALKELVAYLIIERFYREMSALPDSEVGDETFRQIRTILVIDEAHNYLGQKNPFLQKIVREGRSKGIGVFFASQSPNDYNQKDFNFQELLEFVLIFQCEGVSASAIQNLVGCPQSVARELQQDIAKLKPGVVVTKPSVGARSNYVEFNAIPFHKAYA
jgi:DNA sulfur modification protein DndE